MDGHGDTDADIERVKNCQQAQPPLFRIKREHRHGHGEGDGGVRRRPAPENSAAQTAEVEDMTDVRADAVRRMGAAGKGLVGDHNQCAEEFSLSDSPAGQNGSGIFGKETEGKQQQRQVDGQQPPMKTAGHIQERSAGLRVARNQCQSKPDMTRMKVRTMATRCQTSLQPVKQPMRLRGSVTRNCFMLKTALQQKIFYRRKRRKRRKMFVCFLRWLRFGLLVRTGQNHADHPVHKLQFVEIDDEAHGNIEQLHVT